ncbi:MAG: DUF3824 domain-containing protein [Pirellulales bacterium]
MSESSTTNVAVSNEAIHRRLDGIDQMLIGLVPRPERLAIVADLERRIRELAANDPEYRVDAARTPSVVPPADVNPSSTLDRTITPAQPRRRSKLAFISGISGIVSLVMLVATPVLYVVISLYSEMIEDSGGEMAAAIVLLGQVFLVALGGFAAVALGIAGAVVVSKHRQQLEGSGWAATGLCTGMMPMLLGGLLCLIVGLPTILSFSVANQQPQTVASVDVAGLPYPTPVNNSPYGNYSLPSPPSYGPPTVPSSSYHPGTAPAILPPTSNTTPSHPYVHPPALPASPNLPQPMSDPKSAPWHPASPPAAKLPAAAYPAVMPPAPMPTLTLPPVAAPSVAAPPAAASPPAALPAAPIVPAESKPGFAT